MKFFSHLFVKLYKYHRCEEFFSHFNFGSDFYIVFFKNCIDLVGFDMICLESKPTKVNKLKDEIRGHCWLVRTSWIYWGCYFVLLEPVSKNLLKKQNLFCIKTHENILGPNLPKSIRAIDIFKYSVPNPIKWKMWNQIGIAYLWNWTQFYKMPNVIKIQNAWIAVFIFKRKFLTN